MGVSAHPHRLGDGDRHLAVSGRHILWHVADPLAVVELGCRLGKKLDCTAVGGAEPDQQL